MQKRRTKKKNKTQTRLAQQKGLYSSSVPGAADVTGPVNPPTPYRTGKWCSCRRRLLCPAASMAPSPRDGATALLLAAPILFPPASGVALRGICLDTDTGSIKAMELPCSRQQQNPKRSCNLYGSFHYFPSPKTCSINYQFMNSKVLCAALNKREGEKKYSPDQL